MRDFWPGESVGAIAAKVLESMEGRTAGSARIWVPGKPSPRLVGNSDAKAQRSLPSASAKLSIFRSFEYLSCM
jgi:hypothetical protein